RLRVRLRPELVQQARRTLDVSEQEGDGRAREPAWHARMIAARGSLVHSQLPTEAATAGHLVGYARPPPDHTPDRARPARGSRCQARPHQQAISARAFTPGGIGASPAPEWFLKGTTPRLPPGYPGQGPPRPSCAGPRSGL